MKRMYGDTRHISVLKNEFEKNEIDVDDIEIAAARYSASGGKRREERKSKYPGGHVGRLNDVLTEPHFRPAATTTTTSTTTRPQNQTKAEDNSTTERKVSPFDSTESSSLSSSTMSYVDEIENLKNKYEILLDGAENDLKARDESVETNSIFENTTEGHSITSYNQEKLPEHQSSTESVDSKEQKQISSTLKIVKVDDGEETMTNKKRNKTTSLDLPNIDRIDDLGDMIIVESEGGTTFTHQTRNQVKLDATTSSNKPSTTESVSSTTKDNSQLDRVDVFSAESSEIYAESNNNRHTDGQFGEEKHKTTLTQAVPPQQQQQQSPPTVKGSHLYQDAVQKNNQPVPMVSGRGV